MGINPITGIAVDKDQYSYKTEAQTIQQATQQEQEENATTVQSTDTTSSASDSAVSQWQTESAQADLSAVISATSDTSTALVNKANSGAELSKSEIAQLEEVNPSLAASVKRAQAAREQLRSQMQENPAAAAKTAHNAIARYQSPETDQVVRQALSDEYQHYALKYDQIDIGGRV